MKRTAVSGLVALAVIGGIAGWLLQVGLAASGRAIVVPPVTLAVALALIGVLVVLLALPVWRVVRGTPEAHVDPFYATRVVVLAKASSLAGALFAGAVIAFVVFLLTRSVMPAVGSVTMTIAAAIGAIVLVAGGLIAEKMCTIPPEDNGSAGGAAPH